MYVWLRECNHRNLNWPTQLDARYHKPASTFLVDPTPTPRSKHYGQVQLPGRWARAISVIWIPLHLRSIVNMKVLKTHKVSKGCDYSSPLTAVHGSHDQCWWGPHAHVDWRHLCLFGPRADVKCGDARTGFLWRKFRAGWGNPWKLTWLKTSLGGNFSLVWLAGLLHFRLFHCFYGQKYFPVSFVSFLWCLNFRKLSWKWSTHVNPKLRPWARRPPRSPRSPSLQPSWLDLPGCPHGIQSRSTPEPDGREVWSHHCNVSGLGTAREGKWKSIMMSLSI